MSSTVRTAIDSPEALARAQECLRLGQLVGIPGDCGYLVAAGALSASALNALRSVAPDDRLGIALAFPVEVFDWLPYLTGRGVRVARRHWPGPVTLVAGEGLEQGLTRWLPAAVRQAVAPDGKIAIVLPNRPQTRQMVRGLGLPVVLTAPGAAGSAEELQQRTADRLSLVLDAGPFPEPSLTTVVRLQGRQARVEREGAVATAEVEKAFPCRILFVCTGNTCRSPMAKALCEKMLADWRGCSVAELPRHGYIVDSAGIAAFPGDAASPEGVDAIRAFGGDLRQHRSQPLNYELLAHADFVFAMTRAHLRVLYELQQDVGPVPRLLSLAGDDVSDPIGGPPHVYEDCARQIRTCLERLLPEILENG